MTEICIHHYQQIARSHARTGDNRASQAEDRLVPFDQMNGSGRGKSANAFPCPVRRTVIDKDDLVWPRVAASDAREQRRDIVDFVESRNDERNHD
jgi:hypothetical protein